MTDSLSRAARDEVIAYGLRRATMTSIAKRSGVSRATIYRRADSVRQLVLDALTSEFAAMLAEAQASAEPVRAAGGSQRAYVAALVRAGVSQLWADPLSAALLDHDGELLLPYFVERLGRSQRLVIDALAGQIRRGQQDGSIRAGDPATLATALCLAVAPFVVGRRILLGGADDAGPGASDAGSTDGAPAGPSGATPADGERWLDEIARLVEGYLRPEGENAR